MIKYCDLSAATQILFSVCTLAVMILAVFILVNACIRKLHCRYLVLSAGLFLEVMFLLQGIDDISVEQMHQESYPLFSDIIGNMPYIAVVLWLIFSAAAEIAFLLYIYSNKKNMLTSSAFKDSLDALTDGVCFYLSDGQPLLVNAQMNKISGELFGNEIMNANSFFEDLKSNNSGGKAHIISSEPTLVIGTEDEKIWDFRCNDMSVGNSSVRELVAYDVTEQYLLNRELDLRNERLSNVNRRLRRYSGEVEQITNEREILSAKIKVHDNVGHSLLAFRSYLAKPYEERDRESLLLVWRYTISVMKKEAVPDVQRDKWELLLKAAKAVGVKVELKGELPEKGREQEVLIMAMHECLTNTVKHAKGDCLYLNIQSDSNSLTAEITNNGQQPQTDIVESGGLKNLRHTVESAGGIMTVKSKPRFGLILRFEL
ncbi:MAG: sensor histidine kinase [Ruminococcus sp.]